MTIKNLINKLNIFKPPKLPEFTPQPALHPATEAVHRAIAERKKEDPLIGIKIGGKEINHRIIEALGKVDPKGAHVGSVLTTLGSLAGYSCQLVARINLGELAKENKVTDADLVHVAETKDGRKFFFGDSINRPLAEDKYSIWSMAAGAAQHNGCTELPDIHEMFTYVTSSIGTPEFGIPRVPDEQKAFDTSANIVIAFWPVIFPMLKEFCDKPSEWPILFAAAIQETIDMSKNIIDPKLALIVVMESAIPMSKIDLDVALKANKT
jgi:hypothetical protein